MKQPSTAPVVPSPPRGRRAARSMECPLDHAGGVARALASRRPNKAAGVPGTRSKTGLVAALPVRGKRGSSRATLSERGRPREIEDDALSVPVPHAVMSSQDDPIPSCCSPMSHAPAIAPIDGGRPCARAASWGSPPRGRVAAIKARCRARKESAQRVTCLCTPRRALESTRTG
jgi:hypothetical protein